MAMQQYGPGWADCKILTDELWARYHNRVDVRIVPPVRRMDGKGYSPWCISTRIDPREGFPGGSHAAQATYGPGGEHKNIAAALHHTLSELMAVREGEAAVAEQAAMF